MSARWWILVFVPGAGGFLLIGLASNFWVAIGVFVMIWGNNAGMQIWNGRP